MSGHKTRDWGAFGTSIMKKLKRMGGSGGGGQQPPKRARRTVPHLKGKPFPGQWNPKIKG